ncbi:hypothetical protein [Candidatus Viadribacter manganicus]|uniref:Uncharacterized protein n=1 Tax=Candidatus Viadribacter manganicus TaxID=1759059 RepID=A0A1B1AHF0_9PROT|nr:hypothetical protein [Candidatus Viadribacter manganicus]ANP45996.1 hypothetical protein ATE48_08720 [Candidatus Viadribacter manganicus]
MTPPPDAALHLALRALAHHRAARHHDHHSRATEVALAHWARARAISLSRATRSQHPLAQELRQHLRTAVRARRQRDRLLPALAAARAASLHAARAKLCVARLFVDNTRAATLLASLARDLRRLR